MIILLATHLTALTAGVLLAAVCVGALALISLFGNPFG